MGAAHPGYKHGRYSRNLPDRLQGHFLDYLTDPNKLALDSEIALLQTRITELITKLDVEGSAQAWAKAKQVKNDMLFANRRRDAMAFSEKLQELSNLLDKGVEDFQSWEQIGHFIDRLRKVQEAEVKRIQAAQETMSHQEAMAFLTAIAGILRREIKDPQTLTRLTNEFAKLSGPPVSDDSSS